MRNAPITVQNVVTYDAVVQVANPDLRLKPGMTANVSFLVAERQDVIKVPTAALRFQPEGVAQDASSQDGKAPAPQRGRRQRRWSFPGNAAAACQRVVTDSRAANPSQRGVPKIGRQSRAMREEESEERRQAMRREMQTQIRGPDSGDAHT